jgi:hypothetical protein
VAVVAEPYVNGVAMRKVERLVAQLGGAESMSRSTVSRLCKTLDEQARLFRSRPWRAAYAKGDRPSCGLSSTPTIRVYATSRDLTQRRKEMTTAVAAGNSPRRGFRAG